MLPPKQPDIAVERCAPCSPHDAAAPTPVLLLHCHCRHASAIAATSARSMCKAHLAPHLAAQLFGEPLAQRRGAGVQPHDGVVQRPARGPVPEEGSLSLVRDPDRHDLHIGWWCICTGLSRIFYSGGCRHQCDEQRPAHMSQSCCRIIFTKPNNEVLPAEHLGSSVLIMPH